MKKIILIFVLSFLIYGCLDSDDNSVVELDGPILESVNEEGNIEFNGSVTNIGDQPVESVFIVIVVKDENGNIIEANSTPLFDNGNEDILFPQQREFFTVTLNSNPGNVFSKEVEIFYDILDGENTDPDIP